MAILYLGIFLIGSLTGRVAITEARGGMRPQRNLFLIAMGAVATVGTVTLIIWGFAALAWYWPIVAFVGCSILSAFLVTRSSFGFWLGAMPFMDFVAAVGVIYLWVWRWPF